MKRYLIYLKYIINHKWLVFIVGYNIGVPWLQLLLHDMSKLSSGEFFSYAETFYYPNGGSTYNPDDEFDIAWNRHQKYNKHHWQYWVLIGDDGSITALKIPYNYVLEMVSDFLAMEKSHPDALRAGQYFKSKRDNMILEATTQNQIEKLLYKYSDLEMTDIRSTDTTNFIR